MIDVEIDISDLVEALDAVEPALDRELPRGLDLGADVVAAQAKDVHDYVDRTGSLTNSIQNEGVRGAWSGGNLEVAVSAGAPHAAPIEFGSRPHVIEARPNRQSPHLRIPDSGGGFFFRRAVVFLRRGDARHHQRRDEQRGTGMTGHFPYSTHRHTSLPSHLASVNTAEIRPKFIAAIPQGAGEL